MNPKRALAHIERLIAENESRAIEQRVLVTGAIGLLAQRDRVKKEMREELRQIRASLLQNPTRGANRGANPSEDTDERHRS